MKYWPLLLLLLMPTLAFAQQYQEKDMAAAVSTSLQLTNIRDFGASGSQQTATCTANGTSTLTGCSGGDFKVGSFVRIPSAGVSPTISAPAAPTLTTIAQNGATCTGSVVYGYKVASVQAGPNGPMTAAGPAQTITQAAQSAFSAGTNGSCSTKIDWSTVANTTYYAVYKSVAGGSYNFAFAIPAPATTAYDYGDAAQHIFTCVDAGFPCTAPASAVRNDVFAKISSITDATTFTLAALPFPPKYTSANGLSPSTYPNAPGVSGSVTVLHDDTPAFQAIYQQLIALPAPGHATIYIPPGDYNIATEDFYGTPRAFTVKGLTDVTIEGAGWASKLHQVGDRSDGVGSFIESIAGGTDTPNNISGVGMSMRHYAPNPDYALVDPEPLGQNFVTLSTPADASNFFVGQYAMIYNNASVYPGKDYEEVNQVTSADATTGILGLKYPLDRPYSNSLPLPYSGCVNCAGAPLITPNPQGPAVASNITLKDFWYEGDDVFLNVNTWDNLTVSGMYVHSADFNQAGDMRHESIHDNFVIDDNSPINGGSLAVGAQGSGDLQIVNNSYTSYGNGSQQNCQEHSAYVSWIGNTINLVGMQDPPNVTGSAKVALAFLDCYNATFQHNTVTVSTKNGTGLFQFTNFSGKVTDNLFHIDTLAATGAGSLTNRLISLPVNKTFVAVGDNQWDIDNDLGGATDYDVGGMTEEVPIASYQIAATTGDIHIYPHYPKSVVYQVGPLTGNITDVNLGGTRAPGLRFGISFIQAADAVYTLPAATTSWIVSASPPPVADFIGNIAPVANPAPSSITTIWFYDDGTTVHEISRTYNVRTPVHVAALPGTCTKGQMAAVDDWNGTNGACTGSHTNYTMAMCGASNNWFCP